MIVLGGKTYETRSWHRDIRGRIAIHAGKSFPESARRLFDTEPFHQALLAGGFRSSADLPLQAIIGTVELLGCRPADEVRASLPPDSPELRRGNFDSLWAWELARPTILDEPIPYRGKLGLFEIGDLERLQRNFRSTRANTKKCG